MKINTNITALRANLNLNLVQKNLTASTERLSSGNRINKAADDPAGLAISQKMDAQIRGLRRASDNGADGVSFIQTAEGAMTEISNMLQRCRELSVQAANDTNTLDDKQAIQEEIDSLTEEIDRLAKQTEYNTMNILDGSCSRQYTSTKVGIKLISASDDVSVNTYSLTVTREAEQATKTLSKNFTPTDVVSDTAAGTIQINGESISVPAGATYAEVFSSVQKYCEMMNIDVTPVNTALADPTNPEGQCTLDAASELKFTTLLYGADQQISLKASNDVLAAMFGINNNDAPVTGVDAEVSLDTGATSGFSGTAATFITGSRVEITDRGGFNMIFDVSDASVGDTADIEILDAGYVSVQIGANEGQTIDMSIPPVTAEALGIEYCNVCTRDGATEAITAFDAAIQKLSGIRAKLGAYQNRMDSSVSSLDTTTENLTEAYSRIADVDMSEEMTKYTQYSVLVQAGTSMVAQANNQPQTVLQLLQG